VQGLSSNDAMRVFIHHIILALCFQVQLGAQEWEWAKQFGDVNDITTVLLMKPYLDNQALVAGKFSNTLLHLDDIQLREKGLTDIFLAVVNADGKYLWADNIGCEGPLDLKSIAADKNGNIYVAIEFSCLELTIGDTTFVNQGLSDIVVVKYNADKQIERCWHRGTEDLEYIFAIETDQNDNILILSTSFSTDDEYYYHILNVESFNPQFEPNWQQSIVANEGNVVGEKIFSHEESIYLTGFFFGGMQVGEDAFESEREVYNCFISKLSLDGQFEKTLFDTTLYRITDLAFLENDIYMTGTSLNVQMEGDSSIYTYSLSWFKFNSDLEKQRTFIIRKPEPVEGFEFSYDFDTPVSIHISNTGNIIMTGHYSFSRGFIVGNDTLPAMLCSILDNCNNIFIMQFDSSGTEVSGLTIGKEFSNISAPSVMLTDNTLLMGGSFESDSLQLSNYLLINNSPIKTRYIGHWHPLVYYRDSRGFLAAWKNISTSVSLNQQSLSSLLLYPNPTTNTLNLQSEAFTGQPVQVQIFSADGKLVRQQNISGAQQTIQIQTDDLPPGMYIATTIVNQQISSARFIKQ
jgi:hypothetical protein